MEKNNLRALVNTALNELTPDLRTVLTLRYGLGESGRQSIGKISKQLNVKTSRIARMEMKAIRNLRRPTLFAPLLEALEEMGTLIWHEIAEEISEAGSLIRKSENYDKVMDALPGEISLAMKCRYGSLISWIGGNAAEAERDWFRSKYSPETVTEKLGQLVGIWNQKTPPFGVGHLAAQLRVDVPFLRFLLALSPWVAGFYGGYTAERPISSPALRAIRLHRLLLYRYAGMTVSADQIVNDYNAVYHDDQINIPMAKTTMRTRPYLFVEAGDQTLSALGSARDYAAHAEVDDVVAGNAFIQKNADGKKPLFVYERPWAETTAASLIVEILEQRDFCRRQSISKALFERTGGRYQEPSVQLALTTHEDILEVAPEVYALRGTCEAIDPVNTWSEILLTRKACKAFMLERYTGESLNAYPLWTPAMEQHWCLWAESNSELNLGIGFGGESDRAFNRRLYQSLLFVSEPDLWPVSDAVKTQWRFKKQAVSIYHFSRSVPEPLWQKIPSLQDLFSVAVISKRTGYTNWIRTSQALGLGRHSLHAAGSMALLIALEIILPADHWQKRHEPGPQMDSVLILMAKEIRKKGFVHWMDETGAYFKNQLRESIRRVPLGWVSGDWIREFLDAQGGTTSSEPAIEKPLSQEMAEVSIEDPLESDALMQMPEQLRLPF